MGISENILKEVRDSVSGDAIEDPSNSLKDYIALFASRFITLVNQYNGAENKENVMVSMLAELEGICSDLNNYGYTFQANPIETADETQFNVRLDRYGSFLKNYVDPEQIRDDMLEIFNTNTKSMLVLVDTQKNSFVNENAIISE